MSPNQMQPLASANGEESGAAAGAIVPVSDGQAHAVMPYNPFDGVARYWANFALSDRSMKRLVLRAFSEATPPASAMIGKRFTLSRVLIHPVQFADEETGEVTDAHRTVLQTGDDKLLAFVSAGIIKSIGLICMMEGQGPWNPPLVVELRQHDLKSGRRMYSLDLIDTDVESPPQKEPKRAK